MLRVPEKYRVPTELCGFVIISIVLYYLALNLSLWSPELENNNVYYYFFSSIIQGFMGLVAFLGALVVFQIESYENKIQRLSDSVETFVGHCRGSAAKVYSPFEMMEACREILGDPKNESNRSFIEKISATMKGVFDQQWEIRSGMVTFTLLAFCDVILAMIFLFLTPAISQDDYYGGYFIAINFGFSLYVLFYAGWRLIRRKIIGYSKHHYS